MKPHPSLASSRMPGRRLNFRLLASLVTLGIAPVQAAEIDRSKINPVLASVLKVEASGTGASGYSLGSAVAIAPGKFITSCHVTLHAEQVTVLYQGLRWAADRQSADVTHDLCVLSIPGLKAVEPVRQRSIREARPGNSVAAVGYTFGAGLMAQTGVISAMHPFDDSAIVQTTTPFNSGASGGGLFNEQGELIGILTFRLPGANAYYFSVPSDWISSRLLDDSSFKRIAAIQGEQPFWAKPIGELPYFMRAVPLEASGNWQGLLTLADDWCKSEQNNAEAWLVRGQALDRLDRTEAAIEAYRTAVEKDPHSSEAWFALGTASSRRGDHQRVAEVLRHLSTLAPDLADDLAVIGGVGTPHPN